MPLADSDFAKVLNQLYLISRDHHLDDDVMAEALMRAAVILLTIQENRQNDHRIAIPAAKTAHALLDRSLDWCHRMVADR